MKTISEKYNSLLPYCQYLYMSSHFFLIPTFLSIYQERYDVLWIYVSVLVTSILRWGNPKVLIYQYLDHNWVKCIFVYLFVSWMYVIIENKNDFFHCLCIITILCSILIIFIIEWLFFLCFDTKLCIPLHMLLHFYTVIGFIYLMVFDFDYTQPLYSLLTLLYHCGQQVKNIVGWKNG
jgi:hypothetical protein